MKNFLFSLLFLVFIIGCNDSNSSDMMNNEIQANTNNQEQTEVQEKQKEQTVAVIVTNMGTIELELFADLTPKTVENFVGLAQKGYYDGVIFHRVIENFMIQTGDPTGTGRGGESFWGGRFADEFHPTLKHDTPGILSMANAGPNTNGSQFFITLVPTPWLDGKHSVFGKVINGMDVVQAIGKVQTSKPGDKPLSDVVMESVTIEKRTIE